MVCVCTCVCGGEGVGEIPSPARCNCYVLWIINDLIHKDVTPRVRGSLTTRTCTCHALSVVYPM